MKPACIITLRVAAISVSCAGASGAAAKQNAWEAHSVALEGHVGVATPVGGIGVMLDVAPASWLSVDCGLGASQGGLQMGCMLRPRFVIKQSMAVHLGVGASLGPHVQDARSAYGVFSLAAAPMESIGHDAPDDTNYTWARAKWLNLEGGFEKRWPTGLSLRGYAGLASMLNFEDREYHVDENPDRFAPPFDDPQRNLVYAGAAAGVVF